MLGVILGNISLVLDDLPAEGENADRLVAASHAIERAKGLTGQLLTFAKGGAPILASRDINTIIEHASVFSSRGARSSCKFDLAKNLWSAEVDGDQLDQVITNLVINANQAMPDGGRISISTANVDITSEMGLPLEQGRYIRIQIGDEGVGISPLDLSRIFDPYFTTKSTGNGLGLATSYSILKRHRGHISVESALEGGTVFSIYLPATTKPAVGASRLLEQEHHGSGRILVLDDQEDILDILDRMLRSMGYTTILTKSGSEAIEVFRREKQAKRNFAAVFLDLTVPGDRGGADVMQELLQIDPQVIGVVSSGYSNDETMSRFREFGFRAVIPKPFTKSHLANVLQQISCGEDSS